MVAARHVIFRRSLSEIHSKAAVCVWDVGPPPSIAAYTQAWCNFTDTRTASLAPGAPLDVLALFPTGARAQYLTQDTRERIAASLHRFTSVAEQLYLGRINSCAFFLQFVSPVGRVRSCMVHIEALRDAASTLRQCVNTYVDLSHMPGADFTADMAMPYAVNVDERRLAAIIASPNALRIHIQEQRRPPPAADTSPSYSSYPSSTTSYTAMRRPGHDGGPRRWRVLSESASLQGASKKKVVRATFMYQHHETHRYIGAINCPRH